MKKVMMVGTEKLGQLAGFTLLEMLIGLVIFAVGFLGFTGMTIMMVKGNRGAQTTHEGATLVQSVIEDMSGVQWADLGNSSTLPAPNGLINAEVRSEGPMNRNGEVIGVGEGPYIYYRHVVVCKDTDTVAPGASPIYCGSSLGGTSRPSELACNSLSLTAREKMIRVLVNWTDSTGRCHHKHTDSLAFQ